MKRRDFLKTAGVISAGLAMGCATQSARSRSRIIGANDEIRVGVIGFNHQGKAHIKAYRNVPGVRIIALCDVDEQVLGGQVSELEKDGIRVRAYRDMRELFDNKDIDAVSVATPNHWHALATVWACEAGKDVYVEKPVSHCNWEGRRMVEASRRHRRIVQAGLNNRARPGLEEAFAFVRSGAIGRVVRVRAWDYKRRESIGKVAGFTKVPETIDYNLWTGPAPMLPLLRKELHYDWHWQWATGNAEIGNNGVHQLDMVRWALAKDQLPQTVMSFGGRYGYVDDGQTPNAFAAVFSYDDVPIVYESRGLPRGSGAAQMDDVEDVTATGKPVRIPPAAPTVSNGFIIFCEGGYCHGDVVYDNDGKELKRFEDKGNMPQKNFIIAVRSRKRADCRIDILDGHLSTVMCHMGNASVLCGEPVGFEKLKSRLADQSQATMALDRMRRHLAANGIDTAKQPVIAGPVLHMDSANERYTGEHSNRANLFLKDSYREPFVIRV